MSFLRRKKVHPGEMIKDSQVEVTDGNEMSDPSTRGGALGSENEMPEGGDSTRFPREKPSEDAKLGKRPKRSEAV